jgi:ComF family protein
VQITRLLTRPLRAARAAVANHVPSVCAVCHGWGTHRVCAECISRFVPEVIRCRRCALRAPAGYDECGACLIHPPPFERTIAAVEYGHPWDGLITRFKFHDALDLTNALVHRMLEAIRADRHATPDLLLPMPLSDARLRERGYNQAWELTRRLAESFNCAIDSSLLLRVKHTPHQLALHPEQRVDNVHGAFAIEPRRMAEIRGRRVTLVDDVMTTGATAAEAARTLLRGGAIEVHLWVVARTPRPGAVT